MNKETTVYWSLALCIIVLALFVRIHNVLVFNTWWADDGGGHITYVETIRDKGRLPSMAETYLAWHEPTYYAALSEWSKLGRYIGIDSLDWWEFTQVGVWLVFVVGIWLLSYETTGEKWIALLNVFIFSVLFGSVKLSAYITNELLVQTLIIWLAYLFLKWRLLENNQYTRVLLWAVLLAFATLIKVTASIVFVAVVLLFMSAAAWKRAWYLLMYLLLVSGIVIAANIPWYIYKQSHFKEAFTINVYERDNKQSLLDTEGWGILLTANPSFLTRYPQAYSYPLSFSATFIADTFGDYYNLFNNVDRINLLPESEKIQASNGLFTTAEIQTSVLKTNRFGLGMVCIWLVGLAGSIVTSIRNRRVVVYPVFLTILLCGGMAALVYNVLRLPYIERGVLKVQFVYFILPIVTMFAYQFYLRLLEEKWLWALFAFTPFVLYVIIAWPQIYVK